MDSLDLMKQVSETMEYAGQIKPGMLKSFMDFNQSVLSEGSIDVRTKELIAIATSLISNCEWCITFHTKKALDAGATKDQIIEASFVAVLMAGAPALMHMQILLRALEAFGGKE